MVHHGGRVNLCKLGFFLFVSVICGSCMSFFSTASSTPQHVATEEPPEVKTSETPSNRIDYQSVLRPRVEIVKEGDRPIEVQIYAPDGYSMETISISIGINNLRYKVG